MGKNDLFNSKIRLKIKGKNINRFLKRLNLNKIEIWEIKYSKENELEILIKAQDYKKVKKLKTIYDIVIIDTKGILKIKQTIKKNQIFFGTVLIGLIFLIICSNLIFKIEIIHTNKEIRNILLEELKDQGIKKYHFKKSYDQIQVIKKQIIENHKEKIEWLEIENIGTKYLIRVEERKIIKEPEGIENRHIVASKSAIIKKIEAQQGEIVKNINDYVKQGDIVISGEIKLYDQVKKVIPAIGKIYGEVWYETKVTYPLVRKREKLLSHKKKVFVLTIGQTKWEILNFKPFKEKRIIKETKYKNQLVPISFGIEEQQEIKIIEEINTLEEAINKAIYKAEEKIKERLQEEEYIIEQKSLNVITKHSKIELEVFYAVYENITNYKLIEEEE